MGRERDSVVAPHLHAGGWDSPDGLIKVHLVPCCPQDLPCPCSRQNRKCQRRLHVLVSASGVNHVQRLGDLGVRKGRIVTTLARPSGECGVKGPVAGVVRAPAGRDCEVEDCRHALSDPGSHLPLVVPDRLQDFEHVGGRNGFDGPVSNGDWDVKPDARTPAPCMRGVGPCGRAQLDDGLGGLPECGESGLLGAPSSNVVARVDAFPRQLPQLVSFSPRLLERHGRVAAKPEVATLTVHREPENPIFSAGRLDPQHESSAVDVRPWGAQILHLERR